MINRRCDQRFRRRLPVRYVAAGRARAGFIADVSASGLFLLAPLLSWRDAEAVQFEVMLPDGPVVLAGRATWARVVPPPLMCAMRGGAGIRLHAPPERWLSFIRGLSVKAAPAEPRFDA